MLPGVRRGATFFLPPSPPGTRPQPATARSCCRATWSDAGPGAPSAAGDKKFPRIETNTVGSGSAQLNQAGSPSESTHGSWTFAACGSFEFQSRKPVSPAISSTPSDPARFAPNRKTFFAASSKYRVAAHFQGSKREALSIPYEKKENCHGE
jgi:hypothetical protein